MCIKRRNEFRTNNSRKVRGHPAYIYKKEGNEYYFIGITHSAITDRTKNIRLEKNPNFNDLRASYARPFASKENISKFGPKKKNWKLSRKDKKKMKMIRRNVK